ncbi:MAG: adenylyltransferase/cytidyltransferase family protein [Phycisphaera sp.]|nr:MAG: adenylyltransferase/cytidyltransferase family protein [Phycisphaera sp.]
MSPTASHPAIRSRSDLLAWRQNLRDRGLRLVQCHGCFDIVHPGHVRHLRWARAQGDVLLVTITADKGINKGAGRPLIPHDLRAENLASLDMVDAVHIVDEPTAEGILHAIEPDVYVKGREYESNNDPRFAAERAAVEGAGGRVVFSSGDIVFSSSALIAALESGRDTGVDAPTGALAQLLRRPGMAAEDLTATLDAAQGRSVLVVGEAIEEVYRVCQSPQIGAREPVMTLRPAGERRFDAGAAGVAMQFAAMGLSPTLLTCPPAGEAGGRLADRLRHAGVELASLPSTPEPLVVEHYIAGAQKLMTVDHARPIAADTTLRSAITSSVRELAGSFDAVCIADQGLGLLGGPIARAISEILRERSCVLTASAQARNASPLAIRHADMLCLGEQDLRRAVANPSGSLTAAAWSAMDAAQAAAAIVGLGPEGLLAFDRLPEPIDTGDGWPARVRAQPVPSLAPLALDTAGADAALLAAATLALLGVRASGRDQSHAPTIAALFGACAEASAVSRPGYATVPHGDLAGALARLHRAHLVYREPAAPTAKAAS